MRIAYVTAGTHGAGHVVRGLALQRALERQSARHGVRVEYAVFCPATSYQQRLAPDARTFAAEPALWRKRGEADTSELARMLRVWQPDRIVIDLFWVALSLMVLPCPAWLLLRSVPAAWLRGPVEAPFDPQRYERIWAIEPAPGLERFERADAFVYEDERLLGSRDALMAHLGAQADSRLRLVAKAGLDADAALLEAAAASDGGRACRLDLSDADALFPLSHYLRHLLPSDRVFAAAGYNAFWEAQYFGYADRVRFVAGERVVDDQRWRSGLRVERLCHNGADAVASALLSG